MKHLLSIALFSFSLLGFSQHRIGEILPNEIPFTPRIGGTHYIKPFNAQSEVFISIPEGGKYKIIIGEQTIESPTGFFRFFDLDSGYQSVYIYENHQLLYKTHLRTKRNHRIYLEFIFGKGLVFVDETYLHHSETFPKISQRDLFYHDKMIMNEAEFHQFLEYFKRQSFDEKKLASFQAQHHSTAFTAYQIARLISEMSFDQDRLVLAKMAYKNCIDPQNYYKVIDAFSFSSAKEELRKFISHQP